jgi:hypothetical protein
MEEKRLSVKKRIGLITNEIRLGKDGKNTFANYEYFKPDDIFKNLNPLLEKYNLITIFNLKSADTYYIAQLTIEDADSDEKVVYEFDMSKAAVKGANEAQNSGASLTYAKRYILMNAFNLADNDDDFDSDKMSETKGKKPSGKKPADKPKQDDELSGLIEQIAVLTTKLIAINKEKTIDTLKLHIKKSDGAPSNNYNLIKDVTLANAVLAELKKLEVE